MTNAISLFFKNALWRLIRRIALSFSRLSCAEKKKKKKGAAPISRDPYEMRSISVIRGVTIRFELLSFLFLYVFSPFFKGVTVSTNTFLSAKIVRWKPCVRFETSLSDWAKQFTFQRRLMIISNNYFQSS